VRRALVAVFALGACLAACKTPDPPDAFRVDLTVMIDPGARAGLAQVLISVDGAERYAVTLPASAFPDGTGKLHYIPGTTSGTVNFSGAAQHANGTMLGGGNSGDVAIAAGHGVPAMMTLTPGGYAGEDAGVDGGGDGGLKAPLRSSTDCLAPSRGAQARRHQVPRHRTLHCNRSWRRRAASLLRLGPDLLRLGPDLLRLGPDLLRLGTSPPRFVPLLRRHISSRSRRKLRRRRHGTSLRRRNSVSIDEISVVS